MKRRAKNRTRLVVILLSFGVHWALFAIVGLVPVPQVVENVMVTMRVASPEPPDAPPPPEPEPELPPPPPPEPEPPAEAVEAPPPVPDSSPRERRQQAAEPTTASPSGDTAPANFGVVLTGSGGPGGVAVAVGRPDAPVRQTTEVPAVEREVSPRVLEARPTPDARRSRRDSCEGEARDPRTPRGLRRPEYPRAALEARAEGRVRVQVDLDEEGRVLDARAIGGPGYGLDEVAVAAFRDVRFEPALRCGEPVPATVVVSMRFVL